MFQEQLGFVVSFDGGIKCRHDERKPHSRIIHKYKKLAPKPEIYVERYLE